MKIAFLTSVKRKISGKTILNEPLGGTHSAMVNLAKELSDLGHQVYVFSNCLGEEGIYNNVEYLMSNKIIRFSKENDIDIFICVASESALKTNIRAKKTILWVHNDYSPYWNNELSDVASQISGYMVVKSDKVVTVSKWQTKVIQDTFKIPENHIVEKSNGVDLELFKSDNQSLNINQPTKKLIYSSSPDRGLDLLLEFFPEIKKEFPDIELHIYSGFKTWGKTDASFKDLENSIFKNTNQEGVFLHEPIPIAQLAKELESSYLWLYPNHSAPDTYFNAETFCISALEAMASGLPVITSSRGALPEVVIDRVTGVLINHEPYSEEYKNEFIKETLNLLRNEELRNQYSKNARIHAEKFSYKKLAVEWGSFFTELLNETVSTKLSEPPLKARYQAPEVSIIIPSYNRAKNIPYVLQSLITQTFKQFEVIIADDGSTDNTKEIVESFRDKLNLRYVYCGDNKGFRAARTRNIGLSKSRGKIIFFLDSDIVIPTSYLDEHIKAHNILDELIVNSFVYRMKDPDDLDLGLLPEEYIAKHKDNLNGDSREKFNIFDKEPIEEGYFLDSNCLSIKAKHIMEEGFDPSFVGWGHEDTELGYRFSHKYFKFLFLKNNCESYHIYHYVSPEKEVENLANWERLVKKYRLKSFYIPLPKLAVQGDIIIDNLDLEKSCLLTNNITARFEIKVGDKFTGFSPFMRLNL